MWGGNLNLPADEWMELKNVSTHTLDMTHFALYIQGGGGISLTGTLATGSYYLLERGDDNVITDVVGSQVYPATADTALSDTGTILSLLIDNVARDATPALDNSSCANAVGPPPPDGSGAVNWCAGKGDPDFTSMERVSFTVSGSTATNWATNPGDAPDAGAHVNGHDRNGELVFGTPKQAYTAPTGGGPVPE